MKSLMLAGTTAILIGLAGCTPSAEKTDTTPSTSPTPSATTSPEATPTPMSLETVLAGEWRSDDAKARDAFRHPKETLEFFGIEGDDTVIEIWPGGGWYTSVLAPFLKAEGKYVAAGFDPETSEYAKRGAEKFATNFVAKPEVYGDIEVTQLSKTSGPLVAEGTADAVLTFRNVHNWMSGGYADKVFADMYAALKPGGVLGVVEHRLPSSEMQDPKSGSGYVHEDYVKQVAEAAGFKFVESSEINANPNDTADHPFGVWTLPPNSRDKNRDGTVPEGFDPAKYLAIGESDRMTLKFIKPVPEETPAEE